MKNNYSLIAICALIAMVVILYISNQKLRRTVDSQDSAIEEMNGEITYRKTREERLIASKVAAEITTADLAKAYPKVVEELKKEFDVKLKDVKAYVKNQIQATGKGEGTTVNNYYTDSTGVKQFRQELNVRDGYLSMDAVVLDTNKYTYSYSYSDTITTVISAQRKWFLGDEKLVASSRLRNPNARVTSTTNILINNHRDKRWVISAGAYYDPFRQTYGASVNFGYALIKF